MFVVSIIDKEVYKHILLRSGAHLVFQDDHHQHEGWVVKTFQALLAFNIVCRKPGKPILYKSIYSNTMKKSISMLHLKNVTRRK